MTLTWLYIVARDRVDLYDHLRQSFEQVPGAEVVLDRRRGEERRERSLGHIPDRRSRDRRTRDLSERLRTLGWGVTQN